MDDVAEDDTVSVQVECLGHEPMTVTISHGVVSPPCSDMAEWFDFDDTTVLLHYMDHYFERVGPSFLVPPFLRGVRLAGAILEIWGDERTDIAPSANHPSVAPSVYTDSKMQERYNYLKHGRLPKTITEAKLKKQWRKHCIKRYYLDDSGMWCRTGMDRPYTTMARQGTSLHNPVRWVVPDDTAMLKLVLADHNVGHDGRDRTVYNMTVHYKFKGIKKIVDKVIGSCERCSEFKIGHPTTSHAIITSRPLEIVMFDLSNMPMTSPSGNRIVLNVKDHFTKFMWGTPLRDKTMEPIAAFLKDLFTRYPVPERWHCDNGSEFCNHVMQKVIDELRVGVTHGRPRHPQTQGLIEVTNKTVKKKTLKRCMDSGYTTAGQIFEWEPHYLRILEHENDAPLAIYQNLTPFECFFGRPRLAGDHVYRTAGHVERMHTYMHERQVARASKRGLFPVMEDLPVGCVVHVQATKKEMKDKIALSEWHAKGVIHEVSARSEHYMSVRWLTVGLSPGIGTMRVGRKPGMISRFYCRSSFRRVPSMEMQQLFVTAAGYCMQLDILPDGDCRYVFLDGKDQFKVFLTSCAELELCRSIPYAEYPGLAKPQMAEETPAHRAPPRMQSCLSPKTTSSDDKPLVPAGKRKNKRPARQSKTKQSSKRPKKTKAGRRRTKPANTPGKC